MGCFSASMWRQFCRPATAAEGRENLRSRIVRALVTVCRDPIGTVRSAGQRALGESIVVGSLVSPHEDAARVDLDGGNSESMVDFTLRALVKGCGDSKLTVRIQGALALGNLLLLMLPARQRFNRVINYREGAAGGDGDGGAASGPDSTRDSSQVPPEPSASSTTGDAGTSTAMITDVVDLNVGTWVGDTQWMSLCEVAFRLTTDSEKVLASAVRCLGFLASGLSPWNDHQVSTLGSIIDVLVNKILLSGNKIKKAVAAGLMTLPGEQEKTVPTLKHNEEDEEVTLGEAHDWNRWRRHVERCTEAVTPKLVFSVCQALGLCAWILTRRATMLSPHAIKDTPDPTPMLTDASLDRLRTVLCALQRFSRPKVQLQATKALLSLVHARSSGTEAMVLESSLVTVANYIPVLTALVKKRSSTDTDRLRGDSKGRGRQGMPSSSDSPGTKALLHRRNKNTARLHNDDNDVHAITGDVAQDQVD